MALIKKQQTKYGVEAEYWKITYVSLDRENKYGSISLGLYVSSDSQQYLESATTVIDSDLYDDYFEGEDFKNIYNCCYEYVKENEEYFKDAISEV